LVIDSTVAKKEEGIVEKPVDVVEVIFKQKTSSSGRSTTVRHSSGSNNKPDT
jgi:hypothetical protein